MIAADYGALFDLDGVLVDTEGTYSQFWGEMGRIYHPEIPDFAMKIKGSTLPRILGNYFPDPEVSSFVCDKLERFEGEMTFPVFDGVVDFLQDLKSHGIPCAIVTSSGSDKMDRLFAGNPEFASYFDAVITSADVKRSKPDPEGYIAGAERLGVDIERCFVFEDSLNGLAAGMASGATVIGLYTTLPEAELTGRAHALVPSLKGLTVDKIMSVKR